MRRVSSNRKTHVIAVTNQKGGCGKTTTTLNLGASLASRGKRVLLLDLDPQCGLTLGLANLVGAMPGEFEGDIFNVLIELGSNDEKKQLTLDDVAVHSGFRNMHLVPGSHDMCEFSLTMASKIGRENRLKKALQKIVAAKIYDFILIDTPPSLGLLSINAFCAAEKVLVTTLAEPFSIDGIGLLLATLKNVREEINPDLDLLGLLFTRIDTRRCLTRQLMFEVSAAGSFPELSPNHFFKSHVRASNVFLVSAQKRMPVLSFQASAGAALDYLSVAREVEKMCGGLGKRGNRKLRVSRIAAQVEVGEASLHVNEKGDSALELDKVRTGATSENTLPIVQSGQSERIRNLPEANRRARERALSSPEEAQSSKV